MSKILLYTDVHFSTTSSIIRRRGVKYSERLENVIQSVNWAENLADIENCDEIICLGDFFDKPTLSDEELTALTEIKWSSLKHTFIVGNHESSVNGLRYNSVKALSSLGFDIVTEPKEVSVNNNLNILLLPYIAEDNRKPLRDYLTNKVDIILSHNDIKGIRYGRIESPHGFELNEIEENCKLFLNGHLHNGCFVNKAKTILNLGNLTGQNFGEDATEYTHSALILDTDTLELKFFDNPYAYNFYKLDIDETTNIQRLMESLKNNAVVSFKCLSSKESELKECIDKYNKISNYKIVTYIKSDETDTSSVECSINLVDHLKHFEQFVLNELGSSKVVMEELYEVCK